MSLDEKVKGKLFVSGLLALSIAGFSAAAIVIGKAVYSTMRDQSEQKQIAEEFTRTYRFALLKYADTNRDGLVSTAEKDEFDRKLLNNRSVTLIPNTFPRYITNGQEVPGETITRWIKEYKE